MQGGIKTDRVQVRVLSVLSLFEPAIVEGDVILT